MRHPSEIQHTFGRNPFNRVGCSHTVILHRLFKIMNHESWIIFCTAEIRSPKQQRQRSSTGNSKLICFFLTPFFLVWAVFLGSFQAFALRRSQLTSSFTVSERECFQLLCFHSWCFFESWVCPFSPFKVDEWSQTWQAVLHFRKGPS